jgi:hypothetical protein
MNSYRNKKEKNSQGRKKKRNRYCKKINDNRYDDPDLGISVFLNGNVTFYKFLLPGIYKLKQVEKTYQYQVYAIKNNT